ncbi:MAG: glycerol kinase [Actinomycetota bacterium]|jgi:glycerol kinase
MSTCALLAIDAGTTGVRTRAVFDDGAPSVSSYREFTQHFPRPGWVEHDAAEIWEAVAATLADVTSRLTVPVAAIGITNQRETVLAWDAATGEPCARAIVWQDRRTAERCDALSAHLPLVRSVTGLVLDPYFSGTKARWLIDHVDLPPAPRLRIGTIDSWLVWNLTGGAVFATDPTNASRTMLFDIGAMRWSAEMCDLIGVPMSALPEVRPSSGRIGVTAGVPGLADGIPVSGIAGDQQAALFGQACTAMGSAKNTYGTGSFVLLNVGTQQPAPAEGMLTTVAWDLGDGHPVYAMEGAIFVTGAAVQWLRDGLGIISSSSDIGPLAESVPDSGGVYVVPAFTGLGSPWWDPRARGTITGITRGTTRAHIARAVVDAMVHQVRDAIDAMVTATGVPLTELRVDGGASVMDAMLQRQADHLGVRVLRPVDHETTALGAAYLAGLAEGVWSDLDEVGALWRLDAVFEPGTPDGSHAGWLRAVERSRDWALDADEPD